MSDSALKCVEDMLVGNMLSYCDTTDLVELENFVNTIRAELQHRAHEQVPR
jgi:hypothetical protein